MNRTNRTRHARFDAFEFTPVTEKNRLVNGEREFTPAEFAKEVGESVKARSVQRWCETGQLAHRITPGGHYRIPLSALEEFVRIKTSGLCTCGHAA